jgi:hypothetical protein
MQVGVAFAIETLADRPEPLRDVYRTFTDANDDELDAAHPDDLVCLADAVEDVLRRAEPPWGQVHRQT